MKSHEEFPFPLCSKYVKSKMIEGSSTFQSYKNMFQTHSCTSYLPADILKVLMKCKISHFETVYAVQQHFNFPIGTFITAYAAKALL